MRYRQRARVKALSDNRREYFVRQWLNDTRDGGAAMILAALDKVEPGDYADASLEIGDCNRKICLYFELSKSHERRNSLVKLDILIDAAIGLREHLFRRAIIEARFQRAKRKKYKKEKQATSSD